mmetsp:Transcript_28046/g.45141  ORF Transcript_28046/g.45141 Transcript_28046/m.45141 type:complete len:202 (+) Transcript_28046:166-771(+)
MVRFRVRSVSDLFTGVPQGAFNKVPLECCERSERSERESTGIGILTSPAAETQLGSMATGFSRSASSISASTETQHGAPGGEQGALEAFRLSGVTCEEYFLEENMPVMPLEIFFRSRSQITLVFAGCTSSSSSIVTPASLQRELPRVRVGRMVLRRLMTVMSSGSELTLSTDSTLAFGSARRFSDSDGRGCMTRESKFGMK